MVGLYQIFKKKIIFELEDIVGILVKDYGLERNTNDVSMRDLAITDRNKEMIVATLWASIAENFMATENTVIVIRKAVVAEFQEIKQINCTSGTLILVIFSIFFVF